MRENTFKQIDGTALPKLSYMVEVRPYSLLKRLNDLPIYGTNV
jgi:hypothetical protein